MNHPQHHPSGTIYLLHFSQPYKHARHYIGFTTDLPKRIHQHLTGHGARLMEVVTAAGIGWTLARTWNGTRTFERQLKDRHNAPRLCPICHPPHSNPPTADIPF